MTKRQIINVNSVNRLLMLIHSAKRKHYFPHRYDVRYTSYHLTTDICPNAATKGHEIVLTGEKLESFQVFVDNKYTKTV